MLDLKKNNNSKNRKNFFNLIFTKNLHQILTVDAVST